MGKLIETKYSNVKNRIIKRSLKKTKNAKKIVLPLQTNDAPGGHTNKLKRKIPSIMDVEEEPIPKIIKTDNQDVTFSEKSYELPQLLDIVPNQSQTINSEFTIVKGKNSEDIKLKLKDDDSNDLFFADELRSSYESYVNKDFSFHSIDEICLEGLDGITLEAFWKRFQMAIEQATIINNDIKELIWRLISANENIKFYQLPEPRGVLDIYDRFKYLDTDIGVVMEMAYELPDIYPPHVVNHSNIQGSCATFDTRTDVSFEVRKLTLRDVESKYGRALVMVAPQELRRKALSNDSADPNVELMNVEYCILERIGRSRRHGELTQGNMSITSAFKMNPKSVFHYKKQLMHSDLLSKQFFYIKSAVTDQNKTGRLLHLKRFFHNVKSKQLLITEQIVNVIKNKPSYRLEYSELRKIFQDNQQSVLKVVKSQQFHKFFKTDCLYPYRSLYPNAKRSEYMRKARPVEKYIRCLELIDPYVNISADWCKKQEDSDDEDEGEEEVTGNKIYNMECFKEAYYHIQSKGKEGCSLQDLEKLIGIDNKTVRTTIRKLVAKNVVDMGRYDKGKQRHLLYFAKYLEDNEAPIDPKPDPPKSGGSVFSKIKERQRAAREKLGQTEIQQERPKDVVGTSFKFPRIINIDVPHLKCPFFIRIWNKLNKDPYEFYVKAEFISFPKNDTIKLNTRLFGTEQTFTFNESLDYTNFNPTRPPIKDNIGHIYISKRDVNHITKLILLKAALGEIVITNDTLTCLSRKRKRPVEVSIPILSDNVEKLKLWKGERNLQYMGDNPVCVFSEKEGNVSAEIYASTTPEVVRYEKIYPKRKYLSERFMTRIQIILDHVNEKKVFEETFKMVKIIQEEESKEGYEKKIDRKSLARLLNTLVKEGYIVIYKIVMCDGKVTKTPSFICHPSVTHTNSIIQSSYQQYKLKYFVGTEKAIKQYVPVFQKIEKKIQQSAESPFAESDVMNSIRELKKMNKTKYKELKSKQNRLIGRVYGFKPKFIRMRILHEFLFYLIYCYDRDTKPLTNAQVRELFNGYRINLTEADLQEMPKIYCNEISWKMFIPPLPHHKGWPNGWALMCDVILRLPISVLCKLHNVTFEVMELNDTLNHPIKRFYLVKDLPEAIRNAALFKRKFLFDIHASMCYLAYCGLLQFGPQKYKEKDQVFIYLNRQAALLDTTTSEPSYHKIAVKEYKQLSFFFNVPADIDNYWYNVYGISLSTKLNVKKSGQLITLVDVTAKPDLVNAMRSKTQEEALQCDNGVIPGDKRGASGLDSSLWAHIMRNWFWATMKVKAGSGPPPSVMGLRKEKLEKILPRNLSYNELHTSTASVSKVYLHASTSREGQETKLKALKKVPVPLKTSKSVQRITRKIPKPRTKRLREYHDNVDKMILKRIGPNMRVRWNEKEDRMLLLCKAASVFLNPKSRVKQNVPYTVIRDVLHRMCPETRNKTSRACQRHLKMITENYPNLEETVSYLHRFDPISKYFSPLVSRSLKEEDDDHVPFKLRESEVSIAFIILMSYIADHQKEIENILMGNAINVNHLADDNLEHIEKNLVESDESLIKFQQAKDEDDIKKDILKTVIHSSLESKHQPGWAFQLFKIYQKFPDSIIRDAVQDLKHSQTIVFKKLMSRKAKARWHTPFQLSNIYVFSQSTTFNMKTVVETFKTFLNVKDNNKFLDFSQEALDFKQYGQLLGLNEFFSFWEKYRLKFFLPQNTVILNPHIKDHGELVEELAVRWQMTLKKQYQESSDVELEPETETTYKDTGASASQINAKQSEQVDSEDALNNPIDLSSAETGNLETIDRLKTWVTDCMETERERRSPSPEFMDREGRSYDINESMGDPDVDESECIEAKDLDTENKDSTVNKPASREEIPTLEEIKEGMLQSTPPSEKRKIPYITDLSALLNKENFAELNTDEKTLERLKNHFITQYALLEDIILDESEQVQDFYMVKYLQQTMANKKLWNKLQSEMIIKEPSQASVNEQLTKHGASQLDFNLMDEIITFIRERKVLGATGSEIKARFKHKKRNCSLEMILTTLANNGILLRTGICSITFVHYTFQSTWLIETFVLSNDEQKLLEEKTANVKEDVKDNIDKHLGHKKFIMVKVTPWTKVDGSLNEESLKMWLCNILSHCLDYPNISFIKMCEKFCYIKPMDIYCLAEILEQLGCMEILTYESSHPDLFSTWQSSKERHATFLDNFEDMYLAPNNVSMTKMGSFFCDYEE